MSDIDQGVELDLEDEPSPRRSPLKFWGMIVAALLVVGAGGGATWYYLLGGKERFAPAEPKMIEAPLPYFFDLKPFVVTVESRNGPSKFVQLGLSFQLPNASAAELITAVLPKVQDTLRQILLTFKSEDMQSPDGLNRVRSAMLTQLNKMLEQVLGADRIKRATTGKASSMLVENIYFSTLVVE